MPRPIRVRARKRLLAHPPDDEPDTVTYLTAILEDHGYAVCSAHNAEKPFDPASLLKMVGDLLED